MPLYAVWFSAFFYGRRHQTMNNRSLSSKFRIPTIPITSPEIHRDTQNFLSQVNFSTSKASINLSQPIHDFLSPSIVLCSKAVGKVRAGHAIFCILSLVVLPSPWESFGCENRVAVKNGGREENSATCGLRCC